MKTDGIRELFAQLGMPPPSVGEINTSETAFDERVKGIRSRARTRAKDLHCAYGDALVCEMNSEILVLVGENRKRDTLILELKTALGVAVKQLGYADDRIVHLEEVISNLQSQRW